MKMTTPIAISSIALRRRLEGILTRSMRNFAVLQASTYVLNP
jgi:hypothetical protein